MTGRIGSPITLNSAGNKNIRNNKMTIQVTITHAHPNAIRSIKISHVDENGVPKPAAPDTILKPGESGVFWVWGLQNLVITECL